jgi:release factor glutamine methyltransferase
MTIREHITGAKARLAGAGINPGEAARDASFLARHVLGLDRAALLLREFEAMPPAAAAEYAGLIDRRVKREPVAYLRGLQEFWGRDFAVSPGVLIPRPETELIVEIALKLAAASTGLSTICDVGTGSGALAVTLAAELPAARVTATDISGPALDVARANAAKHQVSGRIDFRHGAYYVDTAATFDLIVSNPPYVSDAAYAALAPEVRDYEPHAALAAGDDGLRDIREVLAGAARRLAGNGFLLMEIGHDQAAALATLVENTEGLCLLSIEPDLQGIPRVAVVERKIAGV